MITIRKFTTLACVVALLSVGTACTSDSDDQSKHTIKVEKSGTYALGDLTVSVPDGAVKSGTKLTLTEPQGAKPISTLFASSATFDLAFEGDVQPAKPLTIELKLQGKFLPAGVRPDQALLYTPGPNSSGWRLIPAIVEGNVLKAQVSHLSPKSVSYLTNDGLTQLIARDAQSAAEKQSSCGNEASSESTGKVRIGAKKGWSDKPDSPIGACLFTSDKNVKLHVVNKSNYTLSVASTNGISLNVPASTDLDEQMSLSVAKLIFPNAKVKALLPRGSSMTTPLPAKALPGAVELIGDPNTFLGEAIWGSLKFLAGIFVGKIDDETVRLVQGLLEVGDVVECLKSFANVSVGKVSFGDIYQMVAGKCTEFIAESLAVYSTGNGWEKFWRPFFVVADGIELGWNTVTSALSGIRMQLNGTVRINVAQEFRCLTAKEIKAHPDVPGNAEVFEIWCSGKWVVANLNSRITPSMWGDGYTVALEWNGSRWLYYTGGSSGLSTAYDPVCKRIDAGVRKRICHG